MKRRIFFIVFISIAIYTITVFLEKHEDLVGVLKTFVLLIINQDIALSFQNYFFINLFLSLIAVLLFTAFGKVFMDKLERYYQLPEKSSWCMYPVYGMVLFYFLFLFPAIFFFLYRIIIIVFSVLFLGLIYLWNPKGNKIASVEQVPTFPKKEKGIFYCAFGLIGLITGLSFYHALLYPETYWDSLIYYLHYGKMTWQQHGFPVLYCAQVGLGLGANYPHLYHLLCALFATLFGHYTDMYGQFLSPFAGLLATVLIYQTGKIIFEDRTTAILSTLLFRVIPYTNIYFTYATDYSLVMMFTAAFLYSSVQYIKTGQRFYLIQLAIITGTLPNINYLGWIYLPVFLLVIYIKRRALIPLRQFTGFPTLIIFLLGLPWYIRNWLVTGNPVYAFYPKIFGGKHINLDVLASCYKEWTANGIGVPGTTILSHFLNAPHWFFYIWQVEPVLFAFTVPGIIYLVFSLWNKEESQVQKQIGWIILSLFLLGMFYHLAISNLYLYQIVFILPVMAILGGFAICDTIKEEKWMKYPTVGLVFLVALIPGLSMSIMGPHIMEPRLIAFQNPGLSREQFYEIKFPVESRMWEYINQNLHNTVILTHENRYHLFNDDIAIRHLDDWDIQPLYQENDITKKAKQLYDMGIRYYLFIPNEKNHPIVAKLEIPKMIEKGYLKLKFEIGDYSLYEFQPQR
jgi:hypothetical protein